MSSKSSTSLLLATVAGIVLGGLLGYYLPDAMLSVSFIGQLFVNALRIVVIPMIIASIIVGVAAMADYRRINRAAGKSLMYFLTTSAIAVTVGLILVQLIKPGAGVNTALAVAPAEVSRVTSFSFNQILGSILPDSLFTATSQGQFLGLVLFSLFFRTVLISTGPKGKVIVDFFQSVNEVISKMVRLLLYAAPIGLLSLVATAVAQSQGANSTGGILGSVGLFSLTVLAGFVIQGVVILPLALKLLANRSILEYLADTAPALTTAFGTASSAATLPVTYDCVVENGKVDSRAGALTLPLGAMINMNGTALYLVIAAFFCAQAFQVELSIIQSIIIVVVALLVSFGASLVPNVSLLLLGVVLYSADMPAAAYAGIGLILVVDWFFDRMRVTINVWSDAVGAAVIGETFEFKTARRVTPQVSSRRSAPTRRDSSSRRTDSRQSPTTRQRTDRTERPERKERPAAKDSRQRDQRNERPERKERPAAKDSRQRDQRDERPERKERPAAGDSRQRDQRSDRSQPSNGRGRNQERRVRPDSRPKPDVDRRNSGEQKSEYVLPPVPFHVLETELKARKQPQRQTAKNETGQPAQTSRDTVEAKLSQETIERERTKIAAQLAELKQKETVKPEDHDTVPVETAPVETAPVETVPVETVPVETVQTQSTEKVETPQIEKAETSFPKIDFFSDDDLAAAPTPPPNGAETRKPIAKDSPSDDLSEVPMSDSGAVATEEPPKPKPKSEPEPDKPQQVSFGRGKSRRGPHAKPSESSDDEKAVKADTADDKASNPDYSSENISFGRGKRKKLRR